MGYTQTLVLESPAALGLPVRRRPALFGSNRQHGARSWQSVRPVRRGMDGHRRRANEAVSVTRERGMGTNSRGVEPDSSVRGTESERRASVTAPIASGLYRLNR